MSVEIEEFWWVSLTITQDIRARWTFDYNVNKFSL